MGIADKVQGEIEEFEQQVREIPIEVVGASSTAEERELRLLKLADDLEKKVAAFRADCRLFEAQRDCAQRDRDGLKELVKDLEQRVHGLGQYLADAQKQNKKLAAEKEKLHKELTGAWEELAEKYKVLETRYADLARSALDTTNELEKTREQLRKLQELERERDTWGKCAQQRIEERETLRRLLLEAQQKNQKLLEERESLWAKIQKLQHERDGVQESISSPGSLLDNYRCQIDNLTINLRRVTDERDSWRKQWEQATSWEEDCKQAVARNVELKRANVVLQETCDALENDEKSDEDVELKAKLLLCLTKFLCKPRVPHELELCRQLTEIIEGGDH